MIAEVHPGGFEPIIGEKEMLRLGDLVARHGRIPDEAADAAVAVVRRFRQLADAAGAVEIAACATSALRRAANGAEVVDRIEAEAGLSVEVISGLREAELIFRAIRAGVLLEPAPALGFDLGGGSVEITLGDAAGLRYAASENLGVGTLTAGFVESDPLSKGDRRRLQAHLTDVLGPVADAVAPHGPRLVVGSSGTLEDIARMAASRSPPGGAPVAQPVLVHPATSSRRSTTPCSAPPRPSACASTASRPAGSTSSRPGSCSSPPRWTCSASTR